MKQKFVLYTTKKNKQGIIVDEYTYYGIKNRSSSFRCSVRGCTAIAKLIDDQFVELSGVHKEHSKTNLKRIDKQHIIDNVKHNATSTCLKEKEIVCKILLEAKNLVKLKQYSIKYLKEIIRNERKKIRNEVIDANGICIDFYNTMENFKFIHFTETDLHGKKMIILFNEQNISHLENTSTLICDGTFFASPVNFKQIYVLHALIFNRYFPIIYVFLHDKSFSSYFGMFNTISRFIGKGKKFNLILDFELAAKKAATIIFPNVDIYYCNFHMGQSFYRNLQKHGLSILYNNNKKYNRYMKMILSLSYEKPEKVINKFDILKNLILVDFNSDSNKKFLDYFQDIYIGSDKLPLFNICSWSTYKRILENIPTTTNVAESWNRSINFDIKSPNPSLNEIIRELRTRDYLVALEISKSMIKNNDLFLNEKTLAIKNVVENYDRYYELTYLYTISLLK